MMYKKGLKMRLAASVVLIVACALLVMGMACGGKTASLSAGAPGNILPRRSTSSYGDRTVLGLLSHDVDVWKSKVASSEWSSVRNIRLTINWASCEGVGKGVYDWSTADKAVNSALSIGVNSVFMTVNGPIPVWARNPACPGDPAMGPPTRVQDFGDFCKALAAHYKGFVDYYQIWNEPGYDLDAPPAKEGTVYYSGYADQSYLGMMRTAYQGIKASDPEAFVGTGSLLNGLTRSSNDYLNYEVLLSGSNQDQSMKVTSDKNIVAERPMYFNYQNKWDGGHVQTGVPTPGKTWYLAEGATYPQFAEWITLQNPGALDTVAHITYMFATGGTQPQDVGVPAHSRVTVDVNSAVGLNKDVSAKVTSTQELVVERPMYFNYANKWTGGSVDAGVSEPARQWFLAEGATQPGFEEWISLMNPNAVPTTVTLTYMFKGGATQVQQVNMSPTSRETINVNKIVGPNKDVSTKIDSVEPIIAERPMYFLYHGAWSGGHTQAGATGAATSWFLSEGTTRSNSIDGYFDEWISIQNPGDVPAPVNITYMFPGQGTKPGSIVVPAHGRETILVNNEVGKDRDVSVQLDSADNVPIIVERPMYFNYHNKWTGGHDELGTRQSGKEFYFAEGTTRNGFEEWLTLQNPGNEYANATVTFMFSDGTTQDKKVVLAPQSRTTVSVNNSVSIGAVADGVAFHPYDYPEYWSKYYRDIKAITDKYGYSGCEPYISEIGWPHEAKRAGFSPEGQRQAIDGVGLGSLFSAGCKKIWIFEDIDDSTYWWVGDDTKQGLFDANGNPWPAWGEYKKWQQQFPNYGNKPTHM